MSILHRFEDMGRGEKEQNKTVTTSRKTVYESIKGKKKK